MPIFTKAKRHLGTSRATQACTVTQLSVKLNRTDLMTACVIDHTSLLIKASTAKIMNGQTISLGRDRVMRKSQFYIRFSIFTSVQRLVFKFLQSSLKNEAHIWVSSVSVKTEQCISLFNKGFIQDGGAIFAVFLLLVLYICTCTIAHLQSIL